MQIADYIQSELVNFKLINILAWCWFMHRCLFDELNCFYMISSFALSVIIIITWKEL